MFLYCFDIVILKINFKNKKKYYFNVFLNKKYLKKQLLSQYQRVSNIFHIYLFYPFKWVILWIVISYKLFIRIYFKEIMK